MIWHSSDINDVLKELSVDKNKGLANGVAETRLKQFGRNTVRRQKKTSFLKHFLSQLTGKINIFLYIVSIVSFAFALLYDNSDFYYPLLIIAIVILNALFSAFQLVQGENALEAIKEATNPKAVVLRDGIEKEIYSTELVPGDIVLLKAGDYICADARIIESHTLRCNEIFFTGENIPVDKDENAVLEDIVPIVDRKNMVFCGCSVIAGTAKVVVVATGYDTENGHNEVITEQSGVNTLPVETRLNSLVKIVTTTIIIFCAIIFTLQIIINFKSNNFAGNIINALQNAVALAVAAIPESLPIISTIVIALGIQRIAYDKIIVKKVKALELLGKTNVICTDKTGIITTNNMRLTTVYNGNDICNLEKDSITEKTAMALRLAAICSTLHNDSTENAIEEACLAYNGVSKEDIEKLYPRLAVVPFESERKMMTSINMINGNCIAIVKGAPEIIAQKCSEKSRDDILKVNEEMTLDGLRTVAVAIRQLPEIPANPNSEDIEHDLIFVGLFGLYDPPRDESVENIKLCSNAGIQTVMITGDSILTAKAIARRIGILTDDTLAITSSELEKMSDEELACNIEKYSVFARVTPADKVRIIKAWQSTGKNVTITGDSIKDSDALSIADVGCILGDNGTEIAKGNADIIISGHSFRSIVNAIKESRGIFENIQKTIRYLLSCNIAEMVLYLAGLIIFRIPPLLSVQLLWINLLTDSLPALSLCTEKAENGVMDKAPTALKGKIFDIKSIILIFVEALFISVISLLSYTIGKGSGIGETMTFLTLGAIQVFHSYNIKSNSSLIKTDFKSNKFMNLSSILMLFVFMFLVLTPAGAVFGLSVLNAGSFFTALGLAFAVIPFSEIVKLILKFI